MNFEQPLPSGHDLLKAAHRNGKLPEGTPIKLRGIVGYVVVKRNVPFINFRGEDYDSFHKFMKAAVKAKGRASGSVGGKDKEALEIGGGSYSLFSQQLKQGRQTSATPPPKGTRPFPSTQPSCPQFVMPSTDETQLRNRSMFFHQHHDDIGEEDSQEINNNVTRELYQEYDQEDTLSNYDGIGEEEEFQPDISDSNSHATGTIKNNAFQHNPSTSTSPNQFQNGRFQSSLSPSSHHYNVHAHSQVGEERYSLGSRPGDSPQNPEEISDDGTEHSEDDDEDYDDEEQSGQEHYQQQQYNEQQNYHDSSNKNLRSSSEISSELHQVRAKISQLRIQEEELLHQLFEAVSQEGYEAGKRAASFSNIQHF
eukprot:gb/GECH01010344.1/.p1 GENE.gb/GECH01010344.1/~~gb/GECH01010344.1/.p1  ORF type:complete len:366 (+),score=104.92 gb/GECH01010344.1/:1-1098(+)